MKKIMLIVLLAAVFFSSCITSGDKESKGGILYTSTGKTSEMLVVSKEVYWKSEIGDTIRSLMGATAPWLVINEPYFDVKWILPKNFGNLYKKYRNILIVDVNELAITEEKILCSLIRPLSFEMAYKTLGIP